MFCILLYLYRNTVTHNEGSSVMNLSSLFEKKDTQLQTKSTLEQKDSTMAVDVHESIIDSQRKRLSKLQLTDPNFELFVSSAKDSPSLQKASLSTYFVGEVQPHHSAPSTAEKGFSVDFLRIIVEIHANCAFVFGLQQLILYKDGPTLDDRTYKVAAISVEEEQRAKKWFYSSLLRGGL